jgi:hypothetical protein
MLDWPVSLTAFAYVKRKFTDFWHLLIYNNSFFWCVNLVHLCPILAERRSKEL